MKRIIVLLVTLFSCLSISAQIQTKFWGLELCEYYNSIEEAQVIIQNRCEDTEIERDVITAYNGTLGGYEWKFINFHFTKVLAHYGLYLVDFSYNYKSIEDAESRYYSLKESLERKYGLQRDTHIENGEMTDVWTDDSTSTCCILRLQKKISIGGDMFWYVFLSYHNGDLLGYAIAKEEEEL